MFNTAISHDISLFKLRSLNFIYIYIILENQSARDEITVLYYIIARIKFVQA